MLMAGFLPFSAIYIELYYIFASIWGHKVRAGLGMCVTQHGAQCLEDLKAASFGWGALCPPPPPTHTLQIKKHTHPLAQPKPVHA